MNMLFFLPAEVILKVLNNQNSTGSDHEAPPLTNEKQREL